ncbi:MAG: dTDP-4-dehydrorhamnose reductase [Bacteroidales bacterium]|nr:dTDP-4-dehydrorhamnose reductase [Bacteroidales bacterium]
MKKILITGANGQLGSDFRELSGKYPGFIFLLTDVNELDITSEKDVKQFFERENPDYLINCAAYTAVDNAEDDEKNADLINNKAVEILAKQSAKFKTRFFHISTDYVFDGNSCTPYLETDEMNPVSAYGKAKAKGELAALKYNTEATIIRTGWLYGNYGKNFVKTMIKLGKEKESLQVVFDQIGTPTYSGDLASAIMYIIDNTSKKLIPYKAGIYNFANEGVCSWYDFALAIHEFAKISCKVYPVNSSAFPTKAKRPSYSVLNKEKIKTEYRMEIPYWRDSLKLCISRMRKEL